METNLAKLITLNDYLYAGDTLFRILQKYSADLKIRADLTGNEIDEIHCVFLQQLLELLAHNEFLTAQSEKIRDFYMYMAKEYPFLAFTFRGRIKSLIRAEGKFNGYIIEFIHDHYTKTGAFPPLDELKKKLLHFRDLIAYRIVISVPRCHLSDPSQQEAEEVRYLYSIANTLPSFLAERGFTPEPVSHRNLSDSPMLDDSVRPFYRDYNVNETPWGYRALHITFYDNNAHCLTEVQLRTKTMDDIAEIGPANHLGYEKRQLDDRAKRDEIPEGESIIFDEAYVRGMMLQQLELSKLDVNMFSAFNNSLINDGCGLYRGRLILPYEHLSRFQNDS